MRTLPFAATIGLSISVFAMPAAGQNTPKGGMDAFDLTPTKVVPARQYISRVRVLGCEITYNGTFDIPVTLSIRSAASSFTPWGAQEDSASSVNDHDFPKDHILDAAATNGAAMSICATSWIPLNGGTNDGNWKQHMTVETGSSSQNMIVLRNGDAVPAIPAFQDQSKISEIVREYVDGSGRIRLFDDEAIFLFELGMTDLSSPAADFQDLVVLVTLADDPIRFQHGFVPPLLICD